MSADFDKALYPAPLMEEEEDNPEIEIDIGEIEEEECVDGEFEANLAEEMDESDLISLASDLIQDYEDDEASRKDWMQTYVDGLELLGM